MKTSVFVPIFEKDGNRLFVLGEDFTADDEDSALKIGFGASFVECIFLEMAFAGEVLGVDIENTPHAKATLGNMPVAVVSGPIFEEVKRTGDEKYN